MEKKTKTKKILGTITFSLFIIICLLNEWYIIAGILAFLIIVLLTGKETNENTKEIINSEPSKPNPKFEKQEIGMYNMNLSDYYKKNYKLENIDTNLLTDYHFFLGVCFQGRYDEFKEVFKGIEKENSLYNSHLKSEHKEYILNQKEDLKKACLIAKKQDEKGIGMDMKVGESVGEYFDRKIQKSKVFMRIFNDINNNNFEQIFTK